MELTQRRRQGVAEIIPGVLYQRGQFLTWTYEQKAHLLEELGISVIVNLWHRVDSDLGRDIPGTAYLSLPMSPSALPADAELLIDYLAGLLRRGHTMLVHCEAGRGRSVWLATRLLARHTLVNKPTAWATVRAIVPRNSVHGPLLRDLEEGTGW